MEGLNSLVQMHNPALKCDGGGLGPVLDTEIFLLPALGEFLGEAFGVINMGLNYYVFQKTVFLNDPPSLLEQKQHELEEIQRRLEIEEQERAVEKYNFGTYRITYRNWAMRIDLKEDVVSLTDFEIKAETLRI